MLNIIIQGIVNPLYTLPFKNILKLITMKIIGKNTDFVAIFDCDKQEYNVYYKNKFLIGGKSKYSDIESYLN